jgi:plasmid stabilization system protein ParE
LPQVLYGERALADLDRLFYFLAEHDPEAAAQAGALIVEAVRILERHPLIGRPVQRDFRELVISHGRSGHVALYRARRGDGQVEILAIRHQREAGYSG